MLGSHSWGSRVNLHSLEEPAIQRSVVAGGLHLPQVRSWAVSATPPIQAAAAHLEGGEHLAVGTLQEEAGKAYQGKAQEGRVGGVHLVGRRRRVVGRVGERLEGEQRRQEGMAVERRGWAVLLCTCISWVALGEEEKTHPTGGTKGGGKGGVPATGGAMGNGGVGYATGGVIPGAGGTGTAYVVGAAP